MSSGTFKATLPIFDVTNFSYLRDTIYEKNITASSGFGGYIGMSFPFGKRLGPKSRLALSVALIENGYTWTKLNPVVDADGNIVESYYSSDLIGVTMKIAVPIGVDIKYGTDAFCSRNTPVGFTVGAGVMPQYNITAFSGGGVTSSSFKNNNLFGVAPYAKAEISFYTGFCWKLKALATLGAVPLIDEKEANPSGGNDYIFQIKETLNINVGVTVLPFSYGWKQIHWWNDYNSKMPYN